MFNFLPKLSYSELNNVCFYVPPHVTTFLVVTNNTQNMTAMNSMFQLVFVFASHAENFLLMACQLF